LDGDAFILQVQGVFTRIRSGLYWWWTAVARLDLFYCAAAVASEAVQERTKEQIYSSGC
jgi:hypothetical protein